LKGSSAVPQVFRYDVPPLRGQRHSFIPASGGRSRRLKARQPKAETKEDNVNQLNRTKIVPIRPAVSRRQHAAAAARIEDYQPSAMDPLRGSAAC
jgi:hypothetical protein